MATATAALRRDTTVMGVVGTAHFFSHFYQLVLPPLFPLLRDHFQVSYTELGLLMTLFFAASGLTQTPAGFLVDRVGARKVLITGLAALVVGITAMGLVPAFWMLFPLVVLAGFGNSVFHPADYALLTSGVTPGRLGRAYSVHTIGGTFGWALAPVTMVALASLFSWRLALVVAGICGLAIVLPLLGMRDSLAHAEQRRAAPAASTAEAARANARLLLAPPIVMCFAFFAFLAAAFVAVQTFMPTTLTKLYGTPLAAANAALTAFLLGSAAGTLAGGVLVDRTRALERIITTGLLACAALFLLVARIDLGTTLLIAVVALAGGFSGLVTPARDMLVRATTPPGSAGKVFGFVYSGLDLGAALTPFLLGMMLDADLLRTVFVFTAVMLLLTIAAGRLVRHPSVARPVSAE